MEQVVINACSSHQGALATVLSATHAEYSLPLLKKMNAIDSYWKLVTTTLFLQLD